MTGCFVFTFQNAEYSILMKERPNIALLVIGNRQNMAIQVTAALALLLRHRQGLV